VSDMGLFKYFNFLSFLVFLKFCQKWTFKIFFEFLVFEFF
jgi:hypothetical protein